MFLILPACSFCILIAAILFAPLLTPHDPLAIRMDSVLLPPGSEHILGTDELGRDIFSRLLYGGRVSIFVGAVTMLLSIAVGVAYGAVSGLAGGLIDRIMMRTIDAFLSIPSLLLMIGLQMMFPPSLMTIVLVISLTSWMPVARLIRTEILTLKKEAFIQASTVVGASLGQLLFRHMLPQCLPSVIVLAINSLSHAILAEATLSFLGIGLPPQEPSWGNILMGAQGHLLSGAWWLVIFPGACITYSILVINFLGDKLLDYMAAPQFKKGGQK
ncbi:MAG TPA: ABC transporter permease [Bacillaceae bacterium]